jgi:hypothetical protein
MNRSAERWSPPGTGMLVMRHATDSYDRRYFESRFFPWRPLGTAYPARSQRRHGKKHCTHRTWTKCFSTAVNQSQHVPVELLTRQALCTPSMATNSGNQSDGGGTNPPPNKRIPILRKAACSRWRDGRFPLPCGSDPTYGQIRPWHGPLFRERCESQSWYLQWSSNGRIA